MVNEEDETEEIQTKKIIEIHGMHRKGYVYLEKDN